MKLLFASMLLVGAVFCTLTGCDTNKTTTTRETKVTTPGGETTVKTETQVKQTGDNPPPARGANQ